MLHPRLCYQGAGGRAPPGDKGGQMLKKHELPDCCSHCLLLSGKWILKAAL